jgi:hypothetical protein
MFFLTQALLELGRLRGEITDDGQFELFVAAASVTFLSLVWQRAAKEQTGQQ